MEKKMRLLLVVGAFIIGAFIFGAILLLLIYLLRRLFYEAKGVEMKPREEVPLDKEERLTSVKISSGNEHPCKESVKDDCTIGVDKILENGQVSLDRTASTGGKKKKKKLSAPLPKSMRLLLKMEKFLRSNFKAADDFAAGGNKFNAADDFDLDPNTAASDSN